MQPSTQSSISGGRWQPRVAGGGIFSGSLSPLPTGQLVNLPASAPLRPTGQPFNQSTSRFVHSALHSVLNAVLHSALPCNFCHRFSPLSSVLCPLSSVIDSVIAPFRAAGGSPWSQVAGNLPSVIDAVIYSALYSALNAVLNAVLHSVLDSAPILPSIHSSP